ncbi:MAG: response regulator [Syntrophorhabdales bacterium]|jgi:two-component system chemotaxis response regulator CheY
MPDVNMKILVVDDFQTMRRIVRNILKGLGFTNIVEADSGVTALEILKKEKIDFIVSDLNMPEMTGIELLKTIRASEEWKDLPFLMVTAEGKREQVLDAVKNRVNNYVVKPFTPATLEEKIRNIFEGK